VLSEDKRPVDSQEEDLSRIYDLMNRVSYFLRNNGIDHKVYLSFILDDQSYLFVVVEVDRKFREKLRALSEDLRTLFYGSEVKGVSLIIDYR